MSTEEKIAVMQAYVDGKNIEYKEKGFEWKTVNCNNSNLSWDWYLNNYRIKQEPEYIPFDFNDAEQIIGNIIRHKETKSLSVITNVNPKNVTSSGTVIKYEDLLNKYEYPDGVPCGNLKQ